MIFKSPKLRRPLLKIFSITFSFLLWLYVLSSAQIQVEKNIKINYILPDRYAIKNITPVEITYTLSGPRAFVRSILKKENIITIDLKKRFIPGQNKYTISVKSLEMSFPFGIEVVKVEPSRLSIDLERKSTKIVPIKLISTGEVPSDHKMIESYIYPREVNVSGPRSLVNKVESFETFPIELNGLTGIGQRKLSIVQSDARLYLPFNQVDYHYNLKPTRANLIIKDVPVRFLSTNMVLSSNRREVNLMVLADKVNETSYPKDKIKVIAEIPDNASGNVEVPLKAQLPKGVHLLEIQPATIEVYIK